MKSGKQRIVIALVILFSSLLLAGNTWRFTQHLDSGYWGIDFLWRAVSLLMDRENPYAVYLMEMEDGTPYFGAPNYPVPGLSSMLPLALLAEPTAKWVWLLLNLGFAGGIVWLLQDRHPVPKVALLIAVLLFFASTPLRMVLLNCQTSLYVIFLFLLAQKFSLRFPWFSGLLLTLSLMKYSLTLPLALWFGLRRERFAAGFWAIGWQLALTFAAASWMKSSFIDAFWGPLRLTSSGGVSIRNVASDLFSISSHAGIESMVIPGIIALVLLGLAYMSLLARQAPIAGDDAVLACLAVLSCLLFFHLPYDHVILLLPFWLGLRYLTQGTPRTTRGIMICCLVLLVWCPNEIWSRLEIITPVIERIGSLWWNMGISNLIKFSTLVALLVVIMPGIASFPSWKAIKNLLAAP